jgi:DNA polymerase-3 subunit delta
MIHAFTGDPFLARRALRQAVADAGLPRESLAEYEEGLTAELLGRELRQAGLFGGVQALLNFDRAFQGQAGVAPRKEAMKALQDTPEDALVFVLDSTATDARKKQWRALGALTDLPTPRFDRLVGWVKQELDRHGLTYDRDVPAALTDLFGEDVPGLATEIEKLAVLPGSLDAARVREVVNRPASRSAFDLIDAMLEGKVDAAVAVARNLLDAGEPAPKILGALGWQFALIAHAVAVYERDGRVDRAVFAKARRVTPYVAGKAIGYARRFGLEDVREMVGGLLDAEVAVKTGARNPRWAVESLALQVATRHAR